VCAATATPDRIVQHEGGVQALGQPKISSPKRCPRPTLSEMLTLAKRGHARSGCYMPLPKSSSCATREEVEADPAKGKGRAQENAGRMREHRHRRRLSEGSRAAAHAEPQCERTHPPEEGHKEWATAVCGEHRVWVWVCVGVGVGARVKEDSEERKKQWSPLEEGAAKN
jgi:hypothetical protein